MHIRCHSHWYSHLPPPFPIHTQTHTHIQKTNTNTKKLNVVATLNVKWRLQLSVFSNFLEQIYMYFRSSSQNTKSPCGSTSGERTSDAGTAGRQVIGGPNKDNQTVSAVYHFAVLSAVVVLWDHAAAERFGTWIR